MRKAGETSDRLAGTGRLLVKPVIGEMRSSPVVAYESVIGLEIHAQLLTRSKLFCGCSTEFGSEPNTNVCPVCLGLPGSLPVLNEGAVRFAVRAALALGCKINPHSIFARKNYFYPDLPKGYQISQYDEPFSSDGTLEIEVDGATRRIGIERVHMEEDAGKNVHGRGADSAVDLNRAGVPLIEIVSRPDLRSSAEAAQYMRALREILLSIGVNDGNLEEGSFRCDANVSIRPRGETKLGTRVELKNINSFRFVQKAIDVEIARQAAVLDAGGQIDQETRSFDPASNRTAVLRSKEEAHDYRYFPEPDLPPLVIPENLVAEEGERVGELPAQTRRRWLELGLHPETATTLSLHPEYVRFFEATRRVFDAPVKVGNFMATEVLRGARTDGVSASFTVTPEQLGELIRLVDSGRITGKLAKDVFAELERSDKSPSQIVAEGGYEIVSDQSELEGMLRSLIEQNPRQAEGLRAGKQNLAGFFVGQVMKQTQGKADPKLVSELLGKLLGS